MSELDISLLMRRTRLLLRFYPQAYRAHRGEEIFDTLLETTRPGRGWPPTREMASVIGGGLRARQAANLNRGLPASLRHVGILAAALVMVQAPATLLLVVSQPITNVRLYVPAYAELGMALGSLLAVVTLAATWCGRRWAVAAALAAAVLIAVPCLVSDSRINPQVNIASEMTVPALLALVVLLPLTKRAERPPASLLWLPCLLLAVNLVAVVAAAAGLDIHQAVIAGPRVAALVYPYNNYLSLVPLLVAACWLVTDVRPLAAVTLQFLLWRVLYTAFQAYPAASWTQLAVVTGLPLALTSALVWLLRHRTRTAPPTVG